MGWIARLTTAVIDWVVDRSSEAFRRHSATRRGGEPTPRRSDERWRDDRMPAPRTTALRGGWARMGVAALLGFSIIGRTLPGSLGTWCGLALLAVMFICFAVDPPVDPRKLRRHKERAILDALDAGREPPSPEELALMTHPAGGLSVRTRRVLWAVTGTTVVGIWAWTLLH